MLRAGIGEGRKIVVLDEATSNVDLDTDKRLQRLIREEFKECTILSVAHRIETIVDSDRVVVLDQGRIVEVGVPGVLLEGNSRFAELAGRRN